VIRNELLVIKNCLPGTKILMKFFSRRYHGFLAGGVIFVFLLTVHCTLLTSLYAAVGDTSICKWKDNKKGALTLGYADSMYSHADVAIPAMATRGITGTFWITPGKNQKRYHDRESVWEGMCNRYGFHLANHTMSHFSSTAIDDNNADYELGECYKIIWALNPPGGSRLDSFGIPGDLPANGLYNITPAKKDEMSVTYCVIRAALDVVAASYPGVDHVYSGADQYANAGLLLSDAQATLANGSWDVIHLHGIGGEYISLNTADYFNLLNYLVTVRDTQLWVGTFKDVYKYKMERSSASVNTVETTASYIRINSTSAVDAALYDEPLTFITEVPSSWAVGLTTCCRVTQGTIDAKKIYPVNVWPSSATVMYDAIPGYGEIRLEPYGMDITPPDPPAVMDGAVTGADVNTTNSLSQISANWSQATDAETGIAKYWYRIGITPGGGEILDWIDNGTFTYVTARRAGMELSKGVTYYVAVKAENGVGLQSAAADSNGQCVSVTPGYVSFTDNFETGNFSKWGTPTQSGNNTIQVLSGAGDEDGYGVKCHVQDKNDALISKDNVTISSDTYIQFYLKLDNMNMPQLVGSYNNEDPGWEQKIFRIATLSDGSGNFIGTVAIGNGNMGINMYFEFKDSSGNWACAPSYPAAYAGDTIYIPVSEGAWHKIDLRIKSDSVSNGGVELWVDGIKGFSWLGLNMSNADVRKIEMGASSIGDNISGDLYFDNVTVSDSLYMKVAGISLPDDTTPPAISAVTAPAANITQTTAVITWTTNEDATSQVEYGVTAGYGGQTSEDSNLTTSHNVNLTGLTANTLYHYKVKSKDVANNPAVSSDHTFTTLEEGIIPPSTSTVSGTKAYPNPCDLTVSKPKFIFSSSSGGEVKIYTMNGTLVRTLSASSSIKQWDAKNEDGEQVSKGVYLYKIKNAGGTESKGKLILK